MDLPEVALLNARDYNEVPWRRDRPKCRRRDAQRARAVRPTQVKDNGTIQRVDARVDIHDDRSTVEGRL